MFLEKSTMLENLLVAVFTEQVEVRDFSLL